MPDKTVTELKLVPGGNEGLPETFSFEDEATAQTRTFVRNGEFSYNEATSPRLSPPDAHKVRQYSVEDNASFVAYAIRHMVPKEALITLSKESATAFFDETNREEQICRSFKLSLEYRMALGGEGRRKFSQKDLLTLMETFPEVFDDETLAGNIMLITIKKDIEIESDIDPQNHTFIYKEKGGEQTTTLPRFLTLKLPVFEGSVVMHEVNVEFVFHAPKNEDEKFTFDLTNHGHERTIREAVQTEIAELVEALGEEWEIIHGTTT